MTPPQSDEYLESSVLTASGPRLHLMLIEGALRYVRKAIASADVGNESAFRQSLSRSTDIVAEMIAGVRHNKSDINRQLEQLYLFLFRRLAQTYIDSASGGLSDVERLLEMERETWQLACQRVHVPDAVEPPTQRGALPAVALGAACSESLSLEA